MKIIKEDQNLMIIKDRSEILVFSIGAIFALLGLLIILKPDFFIDKDLVIGISGLISGLFAIFVAKIRDIFLDKTSNKLLFVSKSIIKKKTDEYPLNKIRAIELRQAYRKKGYSHDLRS